MRKTARPVVWEGAGAHSPALDPILGCPTLLIAPRVSGSVGGQPYNIKSPPGLTTEQGLNGGWEFATLSFPC